ncbi:MAG: putative bifunctional diguanylate cyclase/phosphodiesterase [Phenylobacterium sp.]|uniref:putative bifunctional diguanylate cyclase/phosphodiesterase n=1 Tax=Phenylobacterium sp. TaxID=1871053 RepID=UPI00391D87E2
MSRQWLDGAFARLPLLGYRSKLLAVAATAAAFPIAVLFALARAAPQLALGPIVVCALAAAGLALLVLAHLLRPVAVTAAALRGCAGEDEDADAPRRRDEAGRMMHDAQRLAAQLNALRHRLGNRHGVSGLPTREPFFAEVADDMAAHVDPVVMGVIRFVDYDRLAAFDQAAADRALAAFARRLESAVARSRPLAQVDRDCFAVWFRGAVSSETAAGELQAMSYVLQQELGDGELKLTPQVGLGAAVYPRDGGEPHTLMTRAIAALPKAEKATSGKLAFFSAQSTAEARERFALEQDLRQAIRREQFLLHFQPVVDLASGRVRGAEALLRWRHPELGFVPPSHFIPVLEQSSMMDEVGLWVLNSACREARAWKDQGLEDLKMAVNLSARQFHDPALNAMILRTLDRHGLTPEALELELTETAAMEDAERTRRLFGDLRGLGVSVAIDDFGAGYSSLSYLKNLPFTKLKIDREFVTQIDQRADSRAICKALVELGRGLDIAVLAEGVETRDEVETLRNLGCQMFQGYYFARPLPAEGFVRLVNDPDWLMLLASPVHRERADLSRRVAG